MKKKQLTRQQQWAQKFAHSIIRELKGNADFSVLVNVRDRSCVPLIHAILFSHFFFVRCFLCLLVVRVQINISHTCTAHRTDRKNVRTEATATEEKS